MSKINVTLGFDADTSQAQRRINELATSLRQLSAHPVELLDDTDLRDAIKAAKELETHLHKAYNVDTQKLDLSKFSKSLSAAGQDLNYFQKNLSKMGVDGEKAFLNLAKAIATADAPTFRLSGHVKNLFDELVKVGRWQFTSSVMHSLTGAVQTAYYYAQDLNESLTNIRIVTGQSTEEMAQFADKANAAAKALSTTTVKYSDAALIYYQQGLDEQQIEERTAATIKMANVTGQSVETISDQLTSIWNNYYDGSKSLEYYADVLTRLGADTASSSDEITEGLQKFSAVADTVGLSYEYAASALATVTATTRESANTVGTAFKTLFSRIQGLKLGDTLDDGTDLNKYSAALASVGVNIKDTNGDLKEMDTILDEVGARWNVLSKDQQMALAQTVAGVRQYTQFIALMDNWDYFQENLNLALNATGSLGEQAEIYADSWQAAEDRVRASAEGIYKALLDEDFFIGFNNGLADALEGIEGVIEGLGGMKGILFSFGSIFLNMYAKEFPSAITKLTDSFKILTGQASSAMSKLQQENIKSLNSFQIVSDEKHHEVQKKGLIEVAKLKQQLTDKSYTLSKAEIAQAEETIKATEAAYNNVVALQAQADELNKASKAQQELNSGNILQNSALISQAYEQQSAQVKKLGDSYLEQKINVNDLRESLGRLGEGDSTFQLIDSMAKLGKKIGLTKEELKSLSKYDPFKKGRQSSEVTQRTYEKLQKAISAVSNRLKDYTDKSVRVDKINKTLDNQIVSWQNNTKNIDESKEAIKTYISSLEKVFAANKDLGFELPKEELEQLNELLENPETNVKDLEQAFVKLLTTIQNSGGKILGNFTDEQEKARLALLSFTDGSDAAKRAIDNLIKTFSNGAASSFEASEAVRELEENLKDIPDHSVKISESFAKITSSLMSLNAQLNAVKNIKDVFSDENAGAIEKFGSALGFITTSLQSVSSFSMAATSLVKKFTAAQTASRLATEGATKATIAHTAATEASAAAAKAHPYILIGTIVLTAVVSALGAITDGWEKERKAVKESAEAHREALKENKETIYSNQDLITSMREALKVYDESHDNKEELDSITKQLAKSYGIEGSTLATLTGEYGNYEKVLEKAIKLQKQQQRLHYDKLQDNLKEQEKVLWEEVGGKAYYDGEKVYSTGINSLKASEKNYIKDFEEFINERGISNTSRAGVSLTINTDYSIEALENLLRVYKEYINEYSTSKEVISTDVYKYTQDWVKQVEPLLEEYAKTRNESNLFAGFIDPETSRISSLEQYREWAKKYEDNIEEIVSQSFDPNLQKYYELDNALKDIMASGTQVEEKYLANLLETNKEFDKQTLLALNWGGITEETWRRAAQGVENYHNAINELNETKTLKAGAESALDILEKDKGINSENYQQILDSIDWGNAKLGIKSFNDFLQMSLEDQQSYLEEISKRSILPTLNQQIEQAKTLLKQYQTQLNNYKNAFDYEAVVESYSYLQDMAFKSKRDQRDYEDAYNKINWELLDIEKIDLVDFVKLDPEKIQELLDSSKAKLIIDKVQADQKTIDNLSKDIEKYMDEIKVQVVIEGKEAEAKSIFNKLSLDNTEILIEPNADPYYDLIDEIVNSDPSVKVLIKGEIDDSIQKLKEDTAEWLSAASMIGDDYQVATDKVDELAAAFPNILEGYSIVSGEMIQLKKEQVEAAIMTAQGEIDANNAKVKYLYLTQLETAKKDKQIQQDKLDELNKFLGEEAEGYNISYAQIIGYNKKMTDEQQNNAGDVTEEVDEQNKITADSYAKLYNSAYQNLTEYGEKMAEYVNLFAQVQEAVNSGNFNLAVELSKQLKPMAMEITSKYKVVVPQKNDQNKVIPKTADEYAEEYYNQNVQSEFLNQYLELKQKEKEQVEANIEAKNKEISALEAAIAAIDVMAEANKRQLNSISLGLGSDGEKSSSSSKSKEYEKDELNIYYNIDNEIDHINSLLEEQEDIISRATEGSTEHYEALKQQEKLLNRLIEAHKKKKAIAEQDLTNIRPTLESSAQKIGKTITYDDGGMVNEREDIVQYYNDAIEKAAGNERKEALETEKDTLLELIDDYNETIKLIRELNTAITESEYAILDIDITLTELAEKRYEEELKKSEERQKEEEERQKKIFDGLKTELDLKIQIDENSLKKLDYYLDKLSDDFYQMAEAMEVMMKKVPVMENSLSNYENFYNKLQTAWTNGDINSDDYLEGLQQSYDGILDNLSSLVALDKEMIHYYEDTLAAAEDELSHYTDSLEHLTSVLEHYKNIVELVDGEYNFESVDTILKGQAKTIENQMQVAESNYQLMLRQKEMAEEAIRGVDRDSAAWEVLNNKLQAATEAVNKAEEEMLSKTEEWAEAMKAVMENTFAEAAHNMEMAMTQGMGFDMLNGSLDRLSAWQDVYLTTTNKIYEATKLIRTAQQAADKTDNIASKQKLNNYIKEIEGLRDKTNLSKLDLDLAKARYDVLLAEIALEEAQNAKSTVRLQRDSEGNFGYVYTSDTDAITSAEQDLADAQNKLYNIGLDATNEYGKKMLELQQKLSDDLMQLEQDRANGRFAIEGSYEAARDQLIQQYRDLFIAYSEQYTTALGSDINIQEEAWINAYDSMINQTQNWADYTEEYTNVCENAYEQWRDAVAEHNEIIQDILNNTKEKVDDVTAASDNLKDEVLGEVLPAIEDELDMVADLSDNYAHLRDEILETIKYYEDLIDTIEELIRKQAEAKIEESTAEYDISGVKDFSQAMADYLANGGKTTDGWYQALLKGREEKLKQNGYSQFDGEAATNLKTLMLKYERYKAEGVTNDLTEYVESIDRNAGEYFDPDEVRRLIATFASGGYTGSWGPSGRLAVLHEKELVLNANDTLHFLQAAEILRGVSEAIDLQAMANQIMLNPYAGALTSTLADQTLQQQVTIEANFPGVTDRFEIEEAFNNLINTASQYANRK